MPATAVPLEKFMMQITMGLSGCPISEVNRARQIVNDLREKHEI